MPQSEDKDSLIKKYWDCFFVDNFEKAINIADKILEQDRNLGIEYKAKVLLKKGLFPLAYDLIQSNTDYSPLRLFLEFLATGKLAPILAEFRDDTDSQVYKAQCILFTKIYWGLDDIINNPAFEEADKILERVFNLLVEQGDFDRAILSFAQSIDMMMKEQELAKDIIYPVILEQLDNLIELSQKAKYDSTKAKIYLLKARIFSHEESAKDAEILFGKDNNLNGLAEVYTFYAMDLNKDAEEYFDKALKIFIKIGNDSGQGLIYESMASNALLKGAIQDAYMFFAKAEERMKQAGLFETLGLQIQKISLMAVKNEFKEIDKSIQKLLGPSVPKLFRAQAAQVYANTLLHIHNNVEEARALIQLSCEQFSELKRYSQLLHARNIEFQILNLENDLEKIIATGEQIIQLADRLEQFDSKATKYMDIAFAIIRIKSSSASLKQEDLEKAAEYFQKAIQIYQEQGNLSGEADVYQSMGNMFANIGRLEDSYQSLLKAKDLYKQEGAGLQAAITGTLLGILLLDVAVLSEQTYPIAQDHFDQSFEYYQREGLLDLCWKNAFYLGDLNQKFYMDTAKEAFKKKASYYYVEMLAAATEYEGKSSVSGNFGIGGITIDEAFQRAQEFFKTHGDNDIAEKFRR